MQGSLTTWWGTCCRDERTVQIFRLLKDAMQHLCSSSISATTKPQVVPATTPEFQIMYDFSVCVYETSRCMIGPTRILISGWAQCPLWKPHFAYRGSWTFLWSSIFKNHPGVCVQNIAFLPECSKVTLRIDCFSRRWSRENFDWGGWCVHRK